MWNSIKSAMRWMRRHLARIVVSMFIALGILWAVLEPYLAWNDVKEFPLSFVQFLGIATITGIAIFIIKGKIVEGWLKNEVRIRSKITETEVEVGFGNLFEKKGWKAIAVNDFFDSRVDDIVIHNSSLHGKVIREYWRGDGGAWNAEVDKELPSGVGRVEARRIGNRTRYDIGTTVAVRHSLHKFLFVALGKIDVATQEVEASAETLIVSIRELIKKARATCGDEPLNIPLFGGGLGRVQGGAIVLVDLILIGIFEELATKRATFPIRIVLDEGLRDRVNLEAIAIGWR